MTRLRYERDIPVEEGLYKVPMSLYADTITGVCFVVGTAFCSYCERDETNVFPARSDGSWIGPFSLLETTDDVAETVGMLDEILTTKAVSDTFTRYTHGYTFEEDEPDEEAVAQHAAYRQWYDRLFATQ